MKTVDPMKIRDYLEKCSFHELCGWIEHNYAILPKYEVLIGDRIRSLKIKITPKYSENECRADDIERFYSALMHAPKFNTSVYNLLNMMTNRVIYPDIGLVPDIFNNLSTLTKTVILSMLDESKVKNRAYDVFEDRNMKVQYTFIMRLLDIYIPTHNPHILTNALLKYTSLSEILVESSFTDRIIERFKNCSFEVSMKQIVLLHKLIADIYKNREASYEFVERYHNLINTKFFVQDEVIKMQYKYRKFIPPSPGQDVFFYSIFSLFGHGVATVYTDENSFSIKDNIESFLKEFSYTYGNTCNSLVLQVILMNIASIVMSHDCYHVREDAIRYIMNEILDKWDSYTDKEEPFEYIIESNICLPTDTPISTLDEITRLAETDIATEAKEASAKMNNAEKKIYKAYRVYKQNEEKVDSQITKALNGLKGVLTGNVREKIIEGKKFSAIGLLKKLLGGVALFSFSKIFGVITLVTSYALKKKTTASERSKILMEIDTEIAMLEEKIKDARGDDNREAKYAMMRTKKELENAKSRIEYGMEADRGSLSKASKTLNDSRNARGVVA